MTEYERKYREWYNSLPPGEQEELKRKGLDSPLDDHCQVSGRIGEDNDPSLMAVGNANQTPSIVDWLEEEHGIPEEKAEDLLDYVRDYVEEQQSMDYAQALNRIVGELLSSPNVRLACAGLCYALSLDSVNGLGTMAQCAKRLCVTRASISKAAQQWRELLGDSHVSPHLKSQEARAAYSQSQIRKHWRRQTWKQQKP